MRCSTFAAILALGPLPVRAVPEGTGRPPASTVRPPLDLAEAEAQVLDRFDGGGVQGELPRVATGDQAALRWLASVATRDRPLNPFKPGSAGHREAEALKALAACPPERRAEAVTALSLRLAGTRLGLWRWGKALSRAGAMPAPLRRAWEERLLEPGTPALLVDYALRHALCFALAEGDEDRLGSLKQQLGNEFPDSFAAWQRLFGMLGEGGPSFRFWTLPGQQVTDGLLSVHGRRFWIQPADRGLLEMPEGTLWIIPARDAQQPDDNAYLEGADAGEAARLDALLKAAGRKALFAPSRAILGRYGLHYFPILLELDPEGRVLRVRMGDAAPPGP